MEEHPDAMMRPTKAYITYENPQTLNLLSRLAALEKWDEQIDKEKSLNIEQAANPDDIQHENMNRRKGCKNCCHVSWTCSKILVLLLTTVLLILGIKTFLSVISSPIKKINCNQTLVQYGQSLPQLFIERFQNDTEYFNHLWVPEENDYNINIASCYCGGYLKKRGYYAAWGIVMEQSLYNDIDFYEPPGVSFYEKCDKQASKISSFKYISYGSTILIVLPN